MRYVITQNYTAQQQELFNLTAPVNQAYAAANGYEFITSDVSRCPDRAPYWEKIAWLNELLPTLPDGTFVMFQDCDSIDVTGDPKTALPAGYELGMVHLLGGLSGTQLRGWYNSGVIMMINSIDVRNFFTNTWNRNGSNDEKAMNAEFKSLNGNMGNGKPIYDLPNEWNVWHNNINVAKTINIRTFHGMKYADKLVAIKNYLSQKTT